MPFEAAGPNSTMNSTVAVIAALQRQGMLNPSQRDHIIELCQETGAPLDQALSKLGLMTEAAIAEFYSACFSLPRVQGTPGAPPPDLIRKSNWRFLEKHRIIPLSRSGNDITVAIVDPIGGEGLRGLSFALGGKVTPLLATQTQFDRIAALARPELQKDENQPDAASIGDDAAKLKDLASGEPAVKLVNRLVVEAAQQRASDIHIEPKERGVDIRYRVDGVLSMQEHLTMAQGLAAISRLKILASLDIAERRRPQDGRFSFPVAGRSIDLRVSTTPTIFGESIVLRLLEKSSFTLELEALGFSSKSADALRRLIQQPNGILLITGPTGSGKTTTLYALLELLAKRKTKILTIEDPVEYQIDGVSQTQVNPAIGLDFANAMRSFLRHDPDVIMVGEMRDLETARTAVQASLTGHLVLSTLHTNDAPSAITRLLDMGVDDYLVASSLIGVVAQRLVRRICSKCNAGAGDIAACNACNGTGYVGRVAINEILEVEEELKSVIRRGVTASTVRNAARERGFTQLVDDGETKVANGVTDASELQRALGL